MRKKHVRVRRSRQFPYVLKIMRGKRELATYYVNRKWLATFHDELGFIPELSTTIDGVQIGDAAKRIIAKHCGVYDDGTYNHTGDFRSLVFSLEENLVPIKDNYDSFMGYELRTYDTVRAPLKQNLGPILRAALGR